jgi:porin
VKCRDSIVKDAQVPIDTNKHGVRPKSLACCIALACAPLAAYAEELRAPDYLDRIPFDTTTRLENLRGPDPDSRWGSGFLNGFDRSWSEFNDRLQKYGLSLGLSYSLLGQKASNAQQQDYGVGGDFDLFGRWNMTDPGIEWPSALVFNIETRHKIGDYAPIDLSQSIGSILSTSVLFGEQKLSLSEIYWEFGADESGFTSRIGKQDPSATFNIFSYGDPDGGFMGGGVSDAAIPFPDRSWGITARFTPRKGIVYLTGGVYDANADVTKLNFNSVQMGEYFYAVEAGLTPGYGTEGAPVGLYSLMYWQRDSLSQSGTPSAHGYAFTAQQEVGPGKNIVPFARYSWSSGTTAASRQVAVGVVFEEVFGQDQDLIGVAAAWAKPTDTNKRNETSIEAFYRVYLTPNMAITPDIQYIGNPSNTSEYDSSVVVSLRLRLEF